MRRKKKHKKFIYDKIRRFRIHFNELFTRNDQKKKKLRLNKKKIHKFLLFDSLFLCIKFRKNDLLEQ